MFKLFSEDRQRKSAVLQIVRKSVPSETRQQIPKCFRTVLVAVESEIGCTSPSAKLLLSLCPLKYRRINQLVSCLNCMHCDTCLSGITKYSTTASKKTQKTINVYTLTRTRSRAWSKRHLHQRHRMNRRKLFPTFLQL